MSYNVSTFSGSKTVVIEDGTIDNSLDIFLVGKNFSGYGETQNQNFVFLLENFAGSTPPSNPLNGQIWYDTISKKIKVYDESVLIWKSSSSTEVSNTPPTGRTTGDLWWDNVNNQLYAYNGNSYTLIGPQSVLGFGTTQFKTISVIDDENNSHSILAAYVNDSIVFTVSDSSFVLSSLSQVNLGGSFLFSTIKKGITLSNTANDQGVTQGDSIIWGNSSNSLKLNGYTSQEFWLKTETDLSNFDNLINFNSDDGFTLGQDSDLTVFIQNGTGNLVEDGLVPIIRSNTSNILKFQTLNFGNNYFTPLKLEGNNVLPGQTGTTNIGSSTLNFNDVYTQNVKVSNKNLSEKYLGDAIYDLGTVIKVGGSAEVTQSQINDVVLGVVGNDNGVILNSNIQGNNKLNVVIKGRVFIKVLESIVKGDKLKAHISGTAIKATGNDTFFAIALEDNSQVGIKLVEAVII